ncbi:hypothetical protein CYMTET_31549 [Cymbomonas tetramitiformis]|uniref:PDZ domain-containing protein n=1 Tax=Cymbomonas tetramitiformis TaxID=36881 RepID=A0AAE0FGZ0_9CHLO|nr:hypothetical protein CYMTET_31549 [Cymbomonas tetramitiformis]
MSGFSRGTSVAGSRPGTARPRSAGPRRPKTAAELGYERPGLVNESSRNDTRKVYRTQGQSEHPYGPGYLHQGAEEFNVRTEVDRQRSIQLGEADPVPHTVVRRHTRQIEVPYEKEVKVPVRIPKVEQKKSYRQVKVKRLVEVPSTELVDELYTVVEEVPAIRKKTIWVEKVVPEKYMKQVEIQKTRRVRVPKTVLKEVEDWETVSVVDDAAAEVDGYRIDRVGGKKLVEVEEEQEYEAFYRPKGLPRPVNEHELGVLHGERISRRVGEDVFEKDQLPDVSPDSEFGSRPGTAFSRPMTAGSRLSTYDASRMVPRHRPRTPEFEQTQESWAGERHGFRLGVNMKKTDAKGVTIDQLFRGEPAERAGLQVGDTVSAVNGYKTATLRDFRNAVYMAPGGADLEVFNSRDGRKRHVRVVR